MWAGALQKLPATVPPQGILRGCSATRKGSLYSSHARGARVCTLKAAAVEEEDCPCSYRDLCQRHGLLVLMGRKDMAPCDGRAQESSPALAGADTDRFSVLPHIAMCKYAFALWLFFLFVCLFPPFF